VVDDGIVLAMVEVKAAKSSQTLHNFAADHCRLPTIRSRSGGWSRPRRRRATGSGPERERPDTTSPGYPPLTVRSARGGDHFLNWTRKVCVLPSLSPRLNCTHVPAQFELVFQT
jgi:hypothetical protein